MTIFRAPDNRLPTLTKAVQVNIGDDAELSALVADLAHVDFYLAERTHAFVEFCKLLQYTQMLARELLRPEQSIQRSTFNAIVEIMESLPRVRRAISIVPFEDYHEVNGEIPLQCLAAITSEDMDAAAKAMHVLADAVLHLLKEVVRRSRSGEPPPLRQCPECKYAYVVSKYHPEQQYCSHRCSNRISIRRKRAGQRPNQEHHA